VTSKNPLHDLLTSHEYSEVTGVIETNVCDGLFAIANAINRLAAVNEKSLAVQEQGMIAANDLAAQYAESRQVLVDQLMRQAAGRGHDA
jgi:hypothetical protein